MKYRLYIVAVRIDYKGAIVVCMIMGAYSRCTIVGTAAGQGCGMEFIDMLA